MLNTYYCTELSAAIFKWQGKCSSIKAKITKADISGSGDSTRMQLIKIYLNTNVTVGNEAGNILLKIERSRY